MKIQFGLLETASTEDEDFVCGMSDCNRAIKYEEPCFVDTTSSAIYCEKCGKCLRYQKKKQQEREDMGITEVPLIKGLDY